MKSRVMTTPASLLDEFLNATYWPGRDYPDRDVWLARRYTPANLLAQRGTLIHASRDEQGKGRTLVLGINRLKRVEHNLGYQSSPHRRRFPKKSLTSIVGQRHTWYADH